MKKVDFRCSNITLAGKLCNKDQQDALFFFLIYFNNHPLRVSNRLTIHHHEVAQIVLVASQCRCMINTVCCTYSKATSFTVGRVAWGVKLNAHWHLVLRLKMIGGHASPFPFMSSSHTKKRNSVALVRERTIPTERPPQVGEVSANFCG
jgi:hypothetical protein